MGQVAATEFKAGCLELMDRVAERRETFVITKRGKAVAKLVPVERKRGEPLFGRLRGMAEQVGDIMSPVVPAEAWEVLKDWDALNPPSPFGRGAGRGRAASDPARHARRLLAQRCPRKAVARRHASHLAGGVQHRPGAVVDQPLGAGQADRGRAAAGEDHDGPRIRFLDELLKTPGLMVLEISPEIASVAVQFPPGFPADFTKASLGPGESEAIGLALAEAAVGGQKRGFNHRLRRFGLVPLRAENVFGPLMMIHASQGCAEGSAPDSASRWERCPDSLRWSCSRSSGRAEA